jgi:cephalosporin hydroxylase
MLPGGSQANDAGIATRPHVMDDRRAFEEQARTNAARMARDAELRELAIQAFAVSDRYDYSYLWRWLGLPIIQTPDDIVALQEIIWETKPQVVIETGFARGGSAILYSSILHLIGEGRVVTVDVDVREHNRRAVEEHPFGDRVHFVEGSSTAHATMDRVQALVPEGARVMAVLDSNHTHQHVLDELRLYGPLVTEGQLLVVSDTIIEDIPRQTHRSREWGPGNNPMTALQEYLRETDRFELDPWFNGKLLNSSSRGGYLRCVAP